MPAPESMVEAVTLAIMDCEAAGPITPSAARVVARAAIEAMRAPTEAMYQANDQALHNAKKQFGWSKKERSARLAHRTKCVLRWTAMIDAALASHQPSLKAKTGGGK